MNELTRVILKFFIPEMSGHPPKPEANTHFLIKMQTTRRRNIRTAWLGIILFFHRK